MAKYGRSDHTVKVLIQHLKEYGAHVCHLCGQPIDMRLTYPEKRAWSLDHYIPVSKGGSHNDPANGRESHWECNVARGDMDIDEWHSRRPKGTFHLA
jgi:5-methylcytosine-specific restriction endonuclease McrA